MTSKKKAEQKSIQTEYEEEAQQSSYYMENLPTLTVPFAQSNHQFTTAFDRDFHAKLGKFWALSPASVGGAYFDWLTHLAISPGKQLSLFESAREKSAKLFEYELWITSGVKTECCANPTPDDRRFENKGWKSWPYNMYEQAFLLAEEWWIEATSTVHGVSQH
ncbi:MAG: poly-beta-hydroxybutyrate polymerase N-terminal domain-containing protein, partial [Alphaproteobacteria bacterium]|nr:poly-beta-hydroxybutyrate polymerase N-terminal domain-containing protein [Alphaproteobacteria bacterium]